MSGHNNIEKQLVTSIPLAFPDFGIWIAMYIERSITSYFKVPFYRFKNKKKPREEIEKLTIFPISSSPIRTMPIDLLKYIISNLSKKYSIEVIFDKSPISNYFVRNLSSKLKYPNYVSGYGMMLEQFNSDET